MESVTGSLGSVTGYLGSVTGSLESVIGSLESLTGSLGSVTGSIGSVEVMLPDEGRRCHLYHTEHADNLWRMKIKCVHENFACAN